MDEEKTKGRTWNGYVCPGCRTVFRVAADFNGAEVMCPSCNGALRLPKTPQEVRPHTDHPVKLPADEIEETTKPSIPTKPAITTDLKYDDKEPSALQSMLATSAGRLKLTLALLLPVALIIGALVVFPPDGLFPDKSFEENAPLFQPQSEVVEKPAPPPPPVAVNEMPPPEEPPALPEVAVVEPELMPESLPKPVETAPKPEVAVVPSPTPEPQPHAVTEEEELVAAVPAVPEPAPEKPAPVPTLQPVPEPMPDPASAALIHAVTRGDTLSNLSIRYQVDIATIKSANGMNSDVIMLDQKLKIPGGITPAAEPAAPVVAETPAPPPAPAAPAAHTVVRGDTLERIARKYGVTPQQIMQANGMKNDIVRLGRKLVIPPARP